MRCYDCNRPEAHCLCGLVARVENETEILILQHTRERAHAFNTARIAEKSLARTEVQVGHIQDMAKDPSLPGRLEGFGLLYPSAEAKDLSELPGAQRPTKLVVLDGTWHHAKAMYRYIEALHGLPHYTLPAGLVSRFQIRQQPKSYCLSTLEAIQSALRCLEPELHGLDDLLRPFHAMQAQHLASTGTPRPRTRRPRQASRGPTLPRAFGRDFDSLVVVYGEMSPMTVKGAPRELLTFAALRPATGEGFHRVLAGVAIDDEHLSFLRLTGSDLEMATPIADVRAEWQSFLRQKDTVAAWSMSTLDVIARHFAESTQVLPIKGHYLNLRRCRGALEEIIAEEGLSAEIEAGRKGVPLGLSSSRTAERLRSAAAVARFLNGLIS